MNKFQTYILLACFAMLSMLTWAASPLQKMNERIQEKETVKAQMVVCNKIRASNDVYEDYLQTVFGVGCKFAVRKGMLEIKNIVKPGLKIFTDEEINTIFDSREGLEWERIDNYCREGSANYLRDGRVKEIIVSDLYEKLECATVYDKAKKLGIEDVQQ